MRTIAGLYVYRLLGWKENLAFRAVNDRNIIIEFHLEILGSEFADLPRGTPYVHTYGIEGEVCARRENFRLPCMGRAIICQLASDTYCICNRGFHGRRWKESQNRQ